MSQAGAAGSAGGGAGLVNSITGDTGTTVHGAVLLYGHMGSANAGSSVGFNGASATEMDLVVTDGLLNTIIGNGAGNATLTAVSCTGLGYTALHALTSGSSLVAIGQGALSSATTDTYCTAVGLGSMAAANGSTQNTCVGKDSGLRISNGQANTLIGYQAGANVTGNGGNSALGGGALSSNDGTGNTCIGGNNCFQMASGNYNTCVSFNSGFFYTGGESSNILLANGGVAGESNVMRLGSQGAGNLNVNTTYIAGIVGVTVANTQMVTINSSTGQMGVSTILYPGVTSNTGTSAAPTGTASATYVNMGLGSSWKLTPSNYTSVRIHINGQMVNNTTGDGINIIMCYGTGAAPGNGTGPTGTTVGINTIFTDLTGILTNGVPFSKEYIITGLTATTAYWFDLQVKAVTGGTASVLNCEFTAQELQY